MVASLSGRALASVIDDRSALRDHSVVAYLTIRNWPYKTGVKGVDSIQLLRCSSINTDLSLLSDVFLAVLRGLCSFSSAGCPPVNRKWGQHFY